MPIKNSMNPYLLLNTSSTALTSNYITASTVQYVTFPVPQGARQVNVPIGYFQQPSIQTLRCEHDQGLAYPTMICNGCGQTAEKIMAEVELMEVMKKRKMPPLEFNKYINSSDLLEEFIQYLGGEGVKKGEIYNLPLDLFIKWLIIRACEEDKEEPNVVLQLPAPQRQKRCKGCQKFMQKLSELPIHNQLCADMYFKRERVMTHAQ